MAAVVKPDVPAMRVMRREDLPAVTAIEVRAYEFCWSPGIFSDCLKAGHGCWVLADNAVIYGYGVLSSGAGEAHILNICVAPEFQGRGYGRRILRRLIDLARWHGAARIFLEVRPSNPVAIRLYDSMGFNEIGRRPRYYPARGGREDAVVMALELVPPEQDET